MWAVVEATRVEMGKATDLSVAVVPVGAPAALWEATPAAVADSSKRS
jgi:hypothetical protein